MLLSSSALLDVVINITTRYLLEPTTECLLECLANNSHVLAINLEQSQQKANEGGLKVANMISSYRSWHEKPVELFSKETLKSADISVFPRDE